MNEYLRFCVTDFVEATKGQYKGLRFTVRKVLTTSAGTYLADKKGQLIPATDCRLLHSI